jgi:Hypothetical glycosyl hydrolase family 15
MNAQAMPMMIALEFLVSEERAARVNWFHGINRSFSISPQTVGFDVAKSSRTSMKMHCTRYFIAFAMLNLTLIQSACAGRHEKRVKLPQVETNDQLSRRVRVHGYPRLANQIQTCCSDEKTRNLLEGLSFWDLAILDADIVHYLPEYLGEKGFIRSRNPNTILLAYFSAGDVNANRSHQIIAGFNQGLDPGWYMRDIHGNPVPLFQLESGPWTLALNPSTDVNEYLPRYLNEKVVSTGLLDGIFYDWTGTKISWVNHTNPPRSGPIDMNQDGKADSDKKIDGLWSEGIRKTLTNSRRIFPASTVILGNAGWNTGEKYLPLLNGVMMEQFLEGSKRDHEIFGWSAVMRTYAHSLRESLPPRLSMIMANDDKTKQFQKMRFALSSTLMFDGYFCFTNLTGAYGTSRWYDEYSVDLQSGTAARSIDHKGYLGKPLNESFNVLKPSELLEASLDSGKKAESRVWRRDFENGIVLVNPDKKPHMVQLNGHFKKIRGDIDPAFNDGSTLSEIVLASRDGAILLRNHK